MLFTDYLDSVKNTDKEARLYEEIAKFKEEMAEATRIPYFGKLISAVVALHDIGNIEAFKETEHYKTIEGWEIEVDFDKNVFSIYPGPEQRKKIFKVMGYIGAGLFLFWLYRKIRRKCKKNK